MANFDIKAISKADLQSKIYRYQDDLKQCEATARLTQGGSKELALSRKIELEKKIGNLEKALEDRERYDSYKARVIEVAESDIEKYTKEKDDIRRLITSIGLSLFRDRM